MRAAAAGVAVVAVYLATAFVSGRMSILARRPLLDGFTPPPPYRYVEPPPTATTKEKPAAGTFTVSLEPPELGAGVFSTTDMQATLVLEPGAVPAGTPGPVSVLITPLGPSGFARAPGSMRIVGNVYSFALKGKDGRAIEKLFNSGHVVLVYPAPGGEPFSTKHALLRLEGGAWTEVKSNDSANAQQVSGDTQQLGTFAIGESGRPKESPRNTTAIVVGAIVGAAALSGVASYVVAKRRAARRTAASRRRKGRPAGRKRS